MLLQLLLCIFLLTVLLLYLPVRVQFEYRYRQGKGQTALEILLLLGIVRWEWTSVSQGWFFALFHPSLRIPFPFRYRERPWKRERLRKQKSAAVISAILGEGKKYIPKILPYARQLLQFSKLEIKRLEFEIGTGDAAETGIVTGLLWSFLGLLNHLLYRSQGSVQERPRLSIIPDFNNLVLKAYISGILIVRPGHIITVTIRFLGSLFWEKYVLKGAVIGGRTSNSGVNENCHGEY